MAQGIAPGTPARDVKLAGSGRVTGGARKSASTRAQITQALAALAQKQRLGTGLGAAVVMPHPSANMPPGLPAVNAGDNDADDLPAAMPVRR